MGFFDDGSLFGDSLTSLLGNGTPNLGADGLAGAFGNPGAMNQPPQFAPGAGPMPEQGPPMPPNMPPDQSMGAPAPAPAPATPTDQVTGQPPASQTYFPGGQPPMPQPRPGAPPGGQASAAPLPPPKPVNPPPGGPSGSSAGWTPPTPPPRIPTSVGPVAAPPGTPTGVDGASSPFGAAPAGAAVQPQPQSWLAKTLGGGGLLGNALGLDPRTSRELKGALAGGFKAVAQNWNKPGLAAFAGGAGGALEGGLKANDTGTEQQHKLTDTAIKAAQFKETQRRNDQMYDVYQQRIQVAQQRGTPQSRAQAWESSDLGRLNKADVEARAAERQIDIEYQNDLRAAANAGEGKGTELRKEIEDKKAAARAQIYQRYGVDPSKATEIRNRGNAVFSQDGKLDQDKTKTNAHQPKSWDEFNALVKPGQYFVNPSDGKLYKRQSAAPAPLSPDEQGTIQAGPQFQQPPAVQGYPETGGSTNFASAA